MINLNKFARTVYTQNKMVGWWDKTDHCMYEKLQLVCTEIAEATEGERKDLMDDHLPHRKMGEVELADAMIRLLDLGAHCGWVYKHSSDDVEEIYRLIDSTGSIAGKHLFLTILIGALGLGLDADSDHLSEVYSTALDAIVHVSVAVGYDIESAMLEKFEYNKTRADHKRENREKANGKKF